MKHFVLAICLLLPACASGAFQTGEFDHPLTHAAQIAENNGAVVFSTRSQVQTTNNVYFYFIREGATLGDKSKMIQIFRAAGVPIMGSYATTREYQLLNAAPGKYRLYAHTVGYWPDITPHSTMRVPVSVAQWVGRIYDTQEVTFEVFPNKITYIGDIWLEHPVKSEKNQHDYTDEVVRMGEPRLDEAANFLKTFEKVSAPMVYNTNVGMTFRSQKPCDYIQKKLFTPWDCPAAAQ